MMLLNGTIIEIIIKIEEFSRVEEMCLKMLIL